MSGTLTSALEASAAARRRLDDPEAAARQLERLQALTQQALAQMRRIIGELRPAAASGTPAVAGDGESATPGRRGLPSRSADGIVEG